MIPKKKPVPALPRSRFMKAKPNVKAALKTTQVVEKKENEVEKKEIVPNEKETESATEQKKLENTSNSNDINRDTIVSKETESTTVQVVVEDAQDSNQLKNAFGPDNTDSCSTISNEKESDSSSQQKILECIPEADNAERFHAEEKRGTDFSNEILQKSNEIENSLSISRNFVSENRTNEFGSTTNECSSKKSDNLKPASIPPNTDEINENVAAINEARSFENITSIHGNIDNNSAAAAESPEKSVTFATSPTKVLSGNTGDKSSKYPCLTKILAGPKKRLQNKEISERKKKLATFKELPPRSQMTFTDLIYWNPSGEPLKTKEIKRSYLFNPVEKAPTPPPVEEEEEEGNDDNVSLAPKLFVNEDGEIIIDESSLVVKRKKSAVDLSMDAVVIDDNVTYGTFRRKTPKQWTAKETLNFYKALSLVGTDFALMENIIPNRTRRELKCKFKKEEKINMELLHRAMYETDTFQSNLGVEDFNLDIIDIPGLEDHVNSETTDLPVTKKRGRKKRTEISSETLTTDVAGENSKSAPTGKKRGRKKKTELSTRYITRNDSDENGECLDILHDKRKKIVDIASDLSNPDDDLEDINNETISERYLQDSPLLRKRKVKVLSEDSANDDTSQDLFEIQVQVNSCIEGDSPVLHNSEEHTDISSFTREVKSNINIEEHTNSPSISHKIESSTNNVSANCVSDVSGTVPNENRLPLSHIRNDSKIEINENKEIDSAPSKTEPSEKSRNGIATYKRIRRLKVKPNIKTQYVNDTETHLKEEVMSVTHNESLPPTSESLSIIDITDEKLLSDSVTDVVTTTITKTSKRQKVKPNIPQRNRQANIQTTTNRLQPSSLNYTPILDCDIQEPTFSTNTAKITYANNRSAKPSPRTQGLVSSLQVPVINSERASKVSNINSSPFISSLNISSNQTLAIPMTPDNNNVEEQNIQMLVQPSPSGKSLHFYWCNNSSGEMPLPTQISLPPVPLAINTEDV